jgi:acetyl-CoA C-acetyltransferase
MKDVYLVDGARTPCLKAQGKPGQFSASDLALQAIKPLLARQTFLPEQFDEVIVGCVMPSPDETNIARLIALRAGCGEKIPAFTVQRNCASGLQAIDSAMKDIALGRHELVLAGGTEAMSRAPLLFNDKMVQWFSKQFSAKTPGAKLKNLLKFRPRNLSPVIALLQGLRDPLVGLSMGQTAEELATQFSISRADMDAFAFESHQRLAKAQDNNFFDEIVPMVDGKGQVYTRDDGLRRDSTLEKLGKLKPIFDKRYGAVTAGNSSQVTDGAAFLILASKEAVDRYHLPVLAKIRDIEWAGVAPEVMGLGPVNASIPLLKRNQLTMNDIDFWEINEAFAAQVLGCLRAFESDDYCQTHFGGAVVGSPSLDRLNIDGGGIAIGHPVAMTGARVSLHLANILKRENKKFGIATMCIGGGQGGAILLENVREG